MSRPFVALVSNTAVFNPDVHARYDLYPQRLALRQAESQRAEIEIDVMLPAGGLQALTNRRVLVSQGGVLLFDGILDPVPVGIQGQSVTITAIARPPGETAGDDQLAAFGETLKVAPFWDPLFVPQGRENDYAELLAARTEVLTFDRVQGAPSLSPMLGGRDNMSIRPFVGTLKPEKGTGVARKYGLRLEAKWKQLVSERHDHRGALDNLATFTPSGIVADFPKAGTTIGDGFTVVESRAEVRQRFRRDIIERTAEVDVAVDAAEELDPAFLGQGTQKYKLDAVEMDMDLRLEYRGEVERTERLEIDLPVSIDAHHYSVNEEIETITLRDLTQGDEVDHWQPDTNYEEGDERIDGAYIYRARIDHFSGSARTPGNWILVGESRYVASRRISSFFRSERGQLALQHAARRILARAYAAGRCVKASFETTMPRRPWMVTPNMRINIRADQHSASGRLVEYELVWADGGRTFAGTIAYAPIVDHADLPPSPKIGLIEGNIPSASGRVVVEVQNAAAEQETKITGNNKTLTLPETIIKITTAPASATSFEQDMTVKTEGGIGFTEEDTVFL